VPQKAWLILQHISVLYKMDKLYDISESKNHKNFEELGKSHFSMGLYER
jgi:hypothetical protein